MSGSHPGCSWCRGYDEQMAWLAGKSVTEAQQALAAREATLPPGDYNEGGAAATRDYIAAGGRLPAASS